MATTRIEHVRLAGLAACVPREIASWERQAETFGRETADKIAATTGIRARRVVAEGVCASDLCERAAEQVLDSLDWPRDSIDALVFVSQTPDYQLPATACVLQTKLGLPNTCAAFDLNLGCSGYAYGLTVAASLIGEHRFRRVLLLVGDTSTTAVAASDQATAGLFGDAGTATALEFDPTAKDIYCQLGTDGSGYDQLIIRAGGARQPTGERREHQLHMDGAEVFAFTLREVPRLVQQTLTAANWKIEEVDRVVMHQANAFLLGHLSKRLKLTADQNIVAVDGYGNTSCASIPLAICDSLAVDLATKPMRLVLAGFGVGWSWGAVALSTTPLPKPVVVEYEPAEALA